MVIIGCYSNDATPVAWLESQHSSHSFSVKIHCIVTFQNYFGNDKITKFYHLVIHQFLSN